ncbi:MAG: flagellar hook-associated protein FlgL [Pirellulales bacterium]|nr:flagellar hook-associated protein FlgL [Pirellulales bacterium]
MPGITPIPSTRISDQLVRQRLLTQVQVDQAALLRIQSQVSTGRRIETPSDDAPAALRAVQLQRLLERSGQVQTNLKTNQSYLSASDTALGNVSTQLTAIRGTAISVVGSTATDAERQAAAIEVDRALQQLVDIGNHRFRGRALFAGGNPTITPYEHSGGTVRYAGDEVKLQSYSDLDLLFDTNLHGVEVFGGLSDQVISVANFNPSITLDTKLADLRGGQGITPGSVSVSDGTSTRLVDLTKAETVGDIVRLLEANPPTNRQLLVTLSDSGLEVQLDAAGGGALTIHEAGGGSTASELGIRRDTAADTGPILSGDLDPVVTRTTRLDDILGTRARARVRSAGADNDLIITARDRGVDFNDVTVRFVDGGGAAFGFETAVYDDSDPLNKTLTVTIASGLSSAQQVINAINATAQFSAELDPRETGNDGSGKLLDSLAEPANVTVTSGGSGVELDQSSGLLVTNNNRTTVIDFPQAETVEDLLNAINGSAADLQAEINAAGTGINVRSRTSGADFTIGENGGTTATDLGLRTLHAGTLLSSLNYGRGVPTVEGADLTIVRNDGVELAIDLTGAVTVQDVLDRINNHVDNPAGASHLTAEFVDVGNGIRLVDDNQHLPDQLTIRRANLSEAAWALGLIPRGSDESTATSPAVAATATLALPGANNDILLTAETPGTALNDYVISFVDTGLGPGSENLAVSTTLKTIVVGIDPATTTAQDVIDLISVHPVAGQLFNATLVSTDGTPNDGSGLITDLAATSTTAGGEPELLDGTDVNPLETSGVFTALVRLRAALETNNTSEIERSIELLDDAQSQLNFSRADLGTRQQALDDMQLRLEDEDIELKDSLSNELDIDLAQAFSEYTARQAAFQAALQMIGQLKQLTLLDYL